MTREARTQASDVGVAHAISISCESGGHMLHNGHRARCSCGWSSDCYAQLSDTQRAVDVHLRRARRVDFDYLIARSSIGAAIADVKARGNRRAPRRPGTRNEPSVERQEVDGEEDHPKVWTKEWDEMIAAVRRARRTAP